MIFILTAISLIHLKMPSSSAGTKKSSPSRIKHLKKNSLDTTQQIMNSVNNVTDDEDFYKEPIKRIVTPDNQLKLSTEQLSEEITKVLTANDPNIPINISRFSYKEKSFKQDPEGPMDHVAFHTIMMGCSLHIESQEAKQQVEFVENKVRELELQRKEQYDAENDDEPLFTGKNQFNYSERAAQTTSFSMKSRGTNTEPPPTLSFCAAVSHWNIYDTYMSDFSKLESEEEQKSDKKKISTSHESESSSKDLDMVHSKSMTKALQILERMVNHNSEDEIFYDFKYWEDASDTYRNGEGSLLPLWRFTTDRSKRKQITALCWNPFHPDLFAVAYGSYDYMRQGGGMICCYSLKNTSHPEYLFSTDSGVMCLDFHPLYGFLLAAGCYDGTVLVFDIRINNCKPIYVSSIKTGKHTDPVWQVIWQSDELTKELSFYSISTDGLIASWWMSKNELKMESLMHLKLTSSSTKDFIDDVNLSGLAGGSCFDFHKGNDQLFIVGTEEGKIHKCSRAYSGQYLETYHGHHMAIYSLKWNPFHPRCFISCSADWTVKIWDHLLPKPLLSFDLGNGVGDICWSPFSSTVFAAVTSDGKVCCLIYIYKYII